MARLGADTAPDAVLRLHVHGMLVDDPVRRVDNMSMAWGLEARVPFLDQDLVTLAAACPELTPAQHARTSPAAEERALFQPEQLDRLFADPSGVLPRTGGNRLWQLGVPEMWLQVHGVG